MANIDNWINSFLEYTDNSEPPVLFRKWVAISTLAAVLQRKTWLEWGYINFFPNMYVVLVGPPAARKGTAMGPGAKFLRKLGVKVAAEATTREALIRALKESFRPDVSSKTNKMIAHSSLTVFSPELTVFIGYNNLTLMADLADWYDAAERWTYRTKNQGTDEILGVYVNLLGATTPELLQTTLPRDAIGGGLTSRIVFVYEEKKGKLVPMPFLSDNQVRLGEDLEERLSDIHLMTGKFVITEAFLDRWTEWYTDQEENPPFDDRRFEGYLGRRQTHILKLSMIFCAAKYRKEKERMVILKEDLEDAIKLLEETEKKMPRAFGGVGQTELAPIMDRIYQTIIIRKEIKYSELQQIFHFDANKNELELALATLDSAHMINIVYGSGDPIIKLRTTG